MAVVEGGTVQGICSVEYVRGDVQGRNVRIPTDDVAGSRVQVKCWRLTTLGELSESRSLKPRVDHALCNASLTGTSHWQVQWTLTL